MRFVAAMLPGAILILVLFISSFFGRSTTGFIVTSIAYLLVSAAALVLWKRTAAESSMRTAWAWTVAMCAFVGVGLLIGELVPLLTR